jgi:hypothetical protein
MKEATTRLAASSLILKLHARLCHLFDYWRPVSLVSKIITRQTRWSVFIWKLAFDGQ